MIHDARPLAIPTTDRISGDGRRLTDEKFDAQLNHGETVDAIDEDDVTKLLSDAVVDAFVPAKGDEDGYFCGSYLGPGRGYRQYDTLTVAFHLSDRIEFTKGGVEWVAERIDSQHGNATMYEIKRA